MKAERTSLAGGDDDASGGSFRHRRRQREVAPSSLLHSHPDARSIHHHFWTPSASIEFGASGDPIDIVVSAKDDRKMVGVSEENDELTFLDTRELRHPLEERIVKVVPAAKRR